MRRIYCISLAPLLVAGAALVVSPVVADQVFLDDLIVDGSACIGFDCVDGESFGFDTIRLKENNLRIRFVDTSSTASFASNDWQITANDESNGGANKFSIDDIDNSRTPFTIEAASPSNSLYVDSSGRLGFGTANPVVQLHVVDGNTPTLRLEQDGSSGFSPQTWDVAGNEAGFFIRDATNGSALPFRIQPGSDGESLFIKPTGVEVNVAFSAVSDVNKKTGLTPVDPTDTLDRVAELPVTTWSFTSDPSGTNHLGPSAQDFYRTFDIGSDDRHIAPLDAAGVALAAIQGLNAKLEATDDALQRDDESLEAENAVFDPEWHQALMTSEALHPEEDQTISRVFLNGYRLGDLLVRPAQVEVRNWEGSSDSAVGAGEAEEDEEQAPVDGDRVP